LTIDFSGRQAPVVTVAPVTVYGNEPALAVAQASGGTGTYSYTWSTGTCLDSSRCDSVMLADFANPVTVSLVDGNGCNNLVNVEINSKFIPDINIASNYAIVAKSSIDGGQANVTGKVVSKVNNSSIYPTDSVSIDSLTAALTVGTIIDFMDYKSDYGNLTSVNLSSATILTPGRYLITDSIVNPDSLILYGNENSEFYFYSNNNLVFKNANILCSGVQENKVFFYCKEKFIIEKSIIPGSIISNDNIYVNFSYGYNSFFTSKSLSISGYILKSK
jgi:hypothetical protein